MLAVLLGRFETDVILPLIPEVPAVLAPSFTKATDLVGVALGKSLVHSVVVLTLEKPSGRVCGINSRGSYLSLTFSSRFESSSNTLLLASTDFTMSDGGISLKSKSSKLWRNLKRSPTAASNFASASPPAALSAREPDHFSYFSSKERMRSSSVGDGGESSESDDDDERSDSGLGGGDAGGGAGTGLGDG